jgi:hypothetical protein
MAITKNSARLAKNFATTILTPRNQPAGWPRGARRPHLLQHLDLATVLAHFGGMRPEALHVPFAPSRGGGATRYRPIKAMAAIGTGARDGGSDRRKNCLGLVAIGFKGLLALRAFNFRGAVVTLT